jgi:hypothetical protein
MISTKIVHSFVEWEIVFLDPTTEWLPSPRDLGEGAGKTGLFQGNAILFFS